MVLQAFVRAVVKLATAVEENRTDEIVARLAFVQPHLHAVAPFRLQATRATVHRLNVFPPIEWHSVSICYPSASIGPGIEVVGALAR